MQGNGAALTASMPRRRLACSVIDACTEALFTVGSVIGDYIAKDQVRIPALACRLHDMCV